MAVRLFEPRCKSAPSGCDSQSHATGVQPLRPISPSSVGKLQSFSRSPLSSASGNRQFLRTPLSGASGIQPLTPVLNRARSAPNWLLLEQSVSPPNFRDRAVPTLLLSSSSAAALENAENESRMRRLRLPQAATDEKMEQLETARRLMAQRLSNADAKEIRQEDDCTHQFELLSKSVDNLRLKHASLGSSNATGKDRDETVRSNSNKQKIAEDLQEKLEAYKFARKIDPELPPLERLGPSTEPPPAQDIVQNNTSASSLKINTAEVRATVCASRGLELQRRIDIANRRKAEGRLRKMQAKRDEVAKTAGRQERASKFTKNAYDSLGCLSHCRNVSGAWLAILALGNVLKCLKEQVDFVKSTGREKQEYVVEKWRRLSEGKMFVGPYVHKVFTLAATMLDPDVARRLRLMKDMVSVMERIKAKREQAKCLWTSMQSWRIGGVLFMCLKTLVRRILLIQGWWRSCSRRIQKVLNKVVSQWMKVEYKLVLREYVAERQQINKKYGLEEVIQLPPASDLKVVVKCVDEVARTHFLRHELRARRYNLLQDIYIWEHEYKDLMLKTQDLRLKEEQEFEVNHFVGAGGTMERTYPLFVFPPVQPSYLPSDKEVLNMIRRARIERHGYTKIEQDPGGLWETRRRSNMSVRMLTPMVSPIQKKADDISRNFVRMRQSSTVRVFGSKGQKF